MPAMFTRLWTRPALLRRSQPPEKIPLASIVHLDLLEQHEPQKITSIWVQYHRKKPCISGTLQASVWDKIRSRTERWYANGGGGYLSILSQMQPQQERCVFTALQEYQKQGTQAPYYLCMHYFTELYHSKGLVLMRGDVDTEVLTTQEAQFLANVWQLFLLDDIKYALMERFNHNPSQFDFQQVIDHMDTFSPPSTPNQTTEAGATATAETETATATTKQ